MDFWVESSSRDPGIVTEEDNGHLHGWYSVEGGISDSEHGTSLSLPV